MNIKSMLLAAAVCAVLVPCVATADEIETGTFAMGITGCSTPPSPLTKDASYVKNNTTGETILTLPSLTCTGADATTASLTGIPTALLPVGRWTYAVTLMSGGFVVPGQVTLLNGGSAVNLAAWDGTKINSFFPAGAKGFSQAGSTVLYFSAPAP